MKLMWLKSVPILHVKRIIHPKVRIIMTWKLKIRYVKGCWEPNNIASLDFHRMYITNLKDRRINKQQHNHNCGLNYPFKSETTVCNDTNKSYHLCPQYLRPSNLLKDLWPFYKCSVVNFDHVTKCWPVIRLRGDVQQYMLSDVFSTFLFWLMFRCWNQRCETEGLE